MVNLGVFEWDIQNTEMVCSHNKKYHCTISFGMVSHMVFSVIVLYIFIQFLYVSAIFSHCLTNKAFKPALRNEQWYKKICWRLVFKIHYEVIIFLIILWKQCVLGMSSIQHLTSQLCILGVTTAFVVGNFFNILQPFRKQQKLNYCLKRYILFFYWYQLTLTHQTYLYKTNCFIWIIIGDPDLIIRVTTIM